MNLYRCEARNFDEIYSPKIEFKEYNVVSETKCGYWFNHYGIKKFVLKGPGKRFAHETKEMALEYFIARRKRYAHLLKIFALRNEKCLKLANEYTKDIEHSPKKPDFTF